jgi:hypothetical protein
MWPFRKKREEKVDDNKCDYEKFVDHCFDTNSTIVFGNTIPDSPCTKNGKPFSHEKVKDHEIQD